MKYLSLQDCLQTNKIERCYYFNQPNYSPNVTNQTVDYGGARWKGNPGQGWTQVGITGQPGLDNPEQLSGASSAPTFQNVLSNAGSLNTQFQQSIQPGVAQLQGRIGDINKSYQDLVDSIKGQTTAAENAQTRATTTGLGARGIDTNSQLGLSEISAGLQPIEAQQSSALAQANLGQTQDVTQIAQQIASMENTYPGAINAALGLAVPQTQVAGELGAANIQGLYGLQNTLAQINSPLQQAQAKAANYLPVAAGQNLYNITGNTYSNAIPSLLASLGLRMQGGQVVPF